MIICINKPYFTGIILTENNRKNIFITVLHNSVIKGGTSVKAGRGCFGEDRSMC